MSTKSAWLSVIKGSPFSKSCEGRIVSLKGKKEITVVEGSIDDVSSRVLRGSSLAQSRGVRHVFTLLRVVPQYVFYRFGAIFCLLYL